MGSDPTIGGGLPGSPGKPWVGRLCGGSGQINRDGPMSPSGMDIRACPGCPACPPPAAAPEDAGHAPGSRRRRASEGARVTTTQAATTWTIRCPAHCWRVTTGRGLGGRDGYVTAWRAMQLHLRIDHGLDEGRVSVLLTRLDFDRDFMPPTRRASGRIVPMPTKPTTTTTPAPTRRLTDAEVIETLREAQRGLNTWLHGGRA